MSNSLRKKKNFPSGRMNSVTIDPVTSTIRNIPSEVFLTSIDGMPMNCKGIIQEHGGTIHAVNNVVGGTTLIVELPLYQR